MQTYLQAFFKKSFINIHCSLMCLGEGVWSNFGTVSPDSEADVGANIGTVPREPVSWGHSGIPSLLQKENPEKKRTNRELVHMYFLFLTEIITKIDLRREEDEDRDKWQLKSPKQILVCFTELL